MVATQERRPEAEIRRVLGQAKAGYWRQRYARWPRSRRRLEGYALLVPVPGDLPVFLELALATCRLQNATNRVETIVLPDVMTDQIRDIVAEQAESWPGALRLVQLPWLERRLLPVLRDPGRNHGAQLITGVNAARATSVVLHDADLFMRDETLHEDNYRLLREGSFSVVGVEGAWDPWYATKGRQLAATWEQTSRVDWLRAAPPHRHIGHDAVWDGERHTFDTTFWQQMHSEQRQIHVTGESSRIIHFNYVISTYRRFQSTPGPYHDGNFRLLLVRLFIDLFSSGHDSYEVPEFDELLAGVGDPGARVHYLLTDAPLYGTLREKFHNIMQGPWVSEQRRRAAVTMIERFDATFQN
jgi:hypothetical protein